MLLFSDYLAKSEASHGKSDVSLGTMSILLLAALVLAIIHPSIELLKLVLTHVVYSIVSSKLP